MITVKNTSRINILQFLECCSIIQMMPFNGIMNANYDWKSVLKLSLSKKRKYKSFSKGPFLSHFLFFLFCYKLSMPNISNFPLFLIQGSLMKTYTTMYSYFSTKRFVKLFLLINFYFLGMLLHYPRFVTSGRIYCK